MKGNTSVTSLTEAEKSHEGHEHVVFVVITCDRFPEEVFIFYFSFHFLFHM